jgi:hypothetical protein
MPRAFARSRKLRRGPDKLNFADISLMLLRAHRKNPFEEKDPALTKDEQLSPKVCGMDKICGLRKLCIKIFLHKWFDTVVMLLIFANSITLLFSNPLDKDPTTTLNRTLNAFEIFFNVMFTIECIVKIVSTGKHYFSYGWNRMDFVVVILGWAPSIMDVIFETNPAAFNFSAVRAIRALKILRTANSIDGMKQIVSGILNAVPNLLNVMYLGAFVFAIFGLIFVKLYGGVMRQRCFAPVSVWSNTTNLTTTEWQPDLNGPVCSMGRPVHVDRYYCPEGQICHYLNPGASTLQLNPSGKDNHVGFDDFFIASLTVFQIITLEGWVDIMYDVQDALGVWHCLIFCFLVVLGSFFLVNLVIAVIFENYNKALYEARKDETEDLSKKFVMKRKNSLLQQFMRGEGTETTEEGLFHVEITMPVGETSWCKSSQRKFSRYIKKVSHSIVVSERFENCIMVLIWFNTIVLAIEHDDPSRQNESSGMEPGVQAVMDALNTFFSVCFALEMLLKHIGVGWKAYWKNPMDMFDGIIVIVSLVDIVATSIGQEAGTGVISVFRGFRLLRVFKLVRKWKRLRQILVAMLKSAQGLLNFFILLCVIMVIYALIGMEIFGGEYQKYGLDPLPRSNFNSLYWALITVFQVLTGENWNDVMHDHMQINVAYSVVFFVSLFCIGNYVLMNIFLAILLENFDDEEYVEELEKQKEDARERSMSLIESANKAMMKVLKVAELPPDSPRKRAVTSCDLIGLSSMERADVRKKLDAKLQKTRVQEETVLGKSLNFFTAANPIRVVLLRIVNSEKFNNFILALIIVSSVCLAIDSPSLSEDSGLKKVLVYIDVVFTTIFVGEAIMKIIARGFYFSKHAYLRNSWDIMDFVIVLISVLNLILSSLSTGVKIGALKTIRVLRALRPLRVANRMAGVKRVIETIIMSLPAIMNVMLIVLLFLLIFGILGVQLFKGKMYYCSGLESDYYHTSRDECLGVVLDSSGKNVTREWVNRPENFDNVLFAIVTLFGVTTLEMWPDTMSYCVDLTSRGLHPEKNHTPAAAIFFVVLIIICSIVITNLFIGIVVDSFNIVKAQDTGTSHLSENQMRWINTMKLMMRSSPSSGVKPLPGKRRSALGKIILTNEFEGFIMGCIGFNMVIMTLNYWTPPEYPQPAGFRMILLTFNYLFLFIYTMEAVLKLFVVGKIQYFSDNWNRFDFFIVVASLIGLILTFANASVPFDATILRIFRLARIVRLLKRAKDLQALLTTLLFSLPSVSNVSALLMMLYYIFAIIGMNLFGDVPADGEFYSRHANFYNVPNGILLLFRCTTGESWNGVMSDLIKYKGHGLPELYFLSFTIFGSMILVNVLIAVILDNFSDIVNSDDALVNETDIKRFGIEWGKLVVEARFERKNRLRRMDSLRRLQKRLGTKLSTKLSGRKLSKRSRPARNSVQILSGKSVEDTTPRAELKKMRSFSIVRSVSFTEDQAEPVATRMHSKSVSSGTATTPRRLRSPFRSFRPPGLRLTSPMAAAKIGTTFKAAANLGTNFKAAIRKMETNISDSRYLPIGLFHRIFKHVYPPLGFKGIDMANERILRARIRKHVRALHIPVHFREGQGKCVYFFEALVACVGIHFKISEVAELQGNEIIQINLRQRLHKCIPEYAEINRTLNIGQKETLGEVEWGAYVIQRLARKYIAKQRAKNCYARKIGRAYRMHYQILRLKKQISASLIQKRFRKFMVRRRQFIYEEIKWLRLKLEIPPSRVSSSPPVTSGSQRYPFAVPVAKKFATRVIQNWYRRSKGKVREKGIWSMLLRLSKELSTARASMVQAQSQFLKEKLKHQVQSTSLQCELGAMSSVVKSQKQITQGYEAEKSVMISRIDDMSKKISSLEAELRNAQDHVDRVKTSESLALNAVNSMRVDLDHHKSELKSLADSHKNEKARIDAACKIQRFYRTIKGHMPGHQIKSVMLELSKQLKFARETALSVQNEFRTKKEEHEEENQELKKQIEMLQAHLEFVEKDAAEHAREKYFHAQENMRLKNAVKSLQAQMSGQDDPAGLQIASKPNATEMLAQHFKLTIPSFVNLGSHYTYQIEMVLHEKRWSSSCRYSNFYVLHQQMQSDKETQPLPKFPQRHLFTPSEREMRERQRLLEVYMQKLASTETSWKNVNFVSFLDNEESMLRKMVLKETTPS